MCEFAKYLSLTAPCVFGCLYARSYCSNIRYEVDTSLYFYYMQAYVNCIHFVYILFERSLGAKEVTHNICTICSKQQLGS